MIDALLELGCYDEARSSFWWFMHATALTEPDLHVLYRLDGAIGMAEREIPLDGYRHSRPVRVGNAAFQQTQLDIYGALFETAWLYSEGHHALDYDTGVVLGRIADRVCDIWRQPDSGIWEVRNGPFQFTHSKVMCWVALDRAARLADRGELPASHAERWTREAAAIEQYVETECWSDRLRSYTRIEAAAGRLRQRRCRAPSWDDRRRESRSTPRRLRLSLSCRRWRARRRRMLSQLFVLARWGARESRPQRRGGRADGVSSRARERRRSLLGGSRSADGRVSRQFPAGPRSPRAHRSRVRASRA